MDTSPSGKIAWFATLAATLLAVLPVLLPRSWSIIYRADVAVLWATLLAIIWYTRYTFDALQHARTRDELERSRERRSLATALLVELKGIEAALRQFHALGAKGSVSWEHPILTTALQHVTLFEPTTAENVVEFAARVRHLRVGIEVVLAGKKSLADSEREIKTYAALAQAMVPPLAAALVREGGQLPTKRGDEAVVEIPKELPESPFGTFDLKRGWS